MIDDEALVEYLDKWMADSGRPMHATTLEILVDGVCEFVDGTGMSFAEWLAAPRDASNRVIHETS